jgi:DNA-binding transcriptional LysR family regulator
MRVYPEITLDLDFSDRVVDVIEDGFDAVVRFADPGDSGLMSRALGTYRRRLVAAPAYLAANGVPLTPLDLKTHACLHHRFPTSRKFERWPLGPELAGIERELPRTEVASTLQPLIYMAEKGLASPTYRTSPYSGNFAKACSSPCPTTTLTAPDRFGSCGRRAGSSLPSSGCS